ncbi:MarR family winged helix-turn-helix transcriptional regulator [Sphingomonas morindae]|uniref:MarR family transcriptional regulator n=1 Tax=Sphingomonas morindae TaxID=1541170 RepID=A0ABY4XCE9_9SPHN|nr:MarR family transcriptional regulator [Sphingomonas morindae]USI74421.1 MarR family transcriptional regulator [Sphingomonas morindae]
MNATSGKPASERLGEALRDFNFRSGRVFDRVLAGESVSAARLRLLLFIEKHDGARSSDVARVFGHSPRTVTEAIDGVEREGLIARVPDPQDRRAKRLALTEAGRAAIAAAAPRLQHFKQRLFSALSVEEQERLADLLTRLNERLNGIEEELEG